MGQQSQNNKSDDVSLIPEHFDSWLKTKGWDIYPHQLQMLEYASKHEPALLIAPTGAGKTLAGFLPSLIELYKNPSEGLHTLYISPLKALAVDIARNLETPVSEMNLPIRVETRTGDTPQSKKVRQRREPPQILMTTPESLELMLSWPEAPDLFGNLQTIIIDEIHSLVGNKRGDLLSLSLAALRALAPSARSVGLSATIADATQLTPWLHHKPNRVQVLTPKIDKQLSVNIMQVEGVDIPWAGHSAFYAVPEIYKHLTQNKMTLVFVNTRAQAEMMFQALWHHNDENLRIGIHHGSLDVQQRRKVEAAMSKGNLDAIVATSSLDLGIDWADIDLVIQVGAPKGTDRLIQRIGRAGHRLDAISKALVVPANRFEMLEALAAQKNVYARNLDRLPEYKGALDVLAQHLTGRALAGPLIPDDIFAQICTAAPYRDLTRAEFDSVLDFISTGGYALEHYTQFQKIVRGVDGAYRLSNKQVATRWRMNVGTIVESAVMKVRLKGGPVLGEIEEYFVQNLSAGDSFIFAGRILNYVGTKVNTVEVTSGKAAEPKVPAYAGGRLPLTVNMAETVRELLQDTHAHAALSPQLSHWLGLQAYRSALPNTSELLIETFPRGQKFYLVAYSFAGRNAHQTLGLLLTKRMERMGYEPLGFVATDYAIAIWSLKEVDTASKLFSADLLGDDLEEWMAESSMLKRCFRQVATIAGLIDQNVPGAEKTGRQVTINSDLIYDVLRRYQPDHMLMLATRADAARNLTDIRRLSDLLARFDGAIRHNKLDYVSPLAVPLMLEVGRESVTASAVETMLSELESALLEESGLEDENI